MLLDLIMLLAARLMLHGERFIGGIPSHLPDGELCGS